MPWPRLSSNRLAAGGLAAVLALGAATACSSSGGAKAVTSTTAAASFAVPSPTALQGALLTLREAGEPFTEDTSTTSPAGPKSGCPGLDNPLAKGKGAGVAHVEVDLDGGQSGPFFDETLVSEPDPQFSSDAAAIAHGLSTCRTVTEAGTDGPSPTLNLTPDSAEFPSGATAAKFTATVSGTAVVGFLITQRVADAVLLCSVGGVVGGPSVDAPTLYSKALAQAQAALNGGS